jgi:hypothetical protein
MAVVLAHAVLRLVATHLLGLAMHASHHDPHHGAHPYGSALMATL